MIGWIVNYHQVKSNLDWFIQIEEVKIDLTVYNYINLFLYD